MPSDPMWTDSILIDSSYPERSDSSVVTDDNLFNNTAALFLVSMDLHYQSSVVLIHYLLLITLLLMRILMNETGLIKS